MKPSRRLSLALALWLLAGAAPAAGPVNISADLPYVDVQHMGRTVRIQRVQDPDHYIDPDYAQTSRPCPPYCIQPMRLAPGVETVGELELLRYLQASSRGEDVMVIDSREPAWLGKGMIPGAVSLPWTRLSSKTADDKAIAEILEFQFAAVRTGELWNFESAKTLVFYCNGPWCGQSPSNIRALLALGYPPHKIKWYRGGMQSWKLFGLTTVGPEEEK